MAEPIYYLKISQNVYQNHIIQKIFNVVRRCFQEYWDTFETSSRNMEQQKPIYLYMTV